MPRMSATPRLSTTRVSTRHGRLGFAAGAAAAAVSSPPALAAGISQRHWPSHVPTRLPVPAEFYQTLLREFLEGSAAAGGGNWNTVRVLAAAPNAFWPPPPLHWQHSAGLRSVLPPCTTHHRPVALPAFALLRSADHAHPTSHLPPRPVPPACRAPSSARPSTGGPPRAASCATTCMRSWSTSWPLLSCRLPSLRPSCSATCLAAASSGGAVGWRWRGLVAAAAAAHLARQGKPPHQQLVCGFSVSTQLNRQLGRSLVSLLSRDDSQRGGHT